MLCDFSAHILPAVFYLPHRRIMVIIACQNFTQPHVCPVQEMPSAFCWTSARSRWFSIWMGISCRQRNRSSLQPRKDPQHTVPPNFSFSSSCSKEPLAYLPLCVWSGLVSLQQPALCHTSSVSSTSGPSLSVTPHLSSSAPSMTLLHCFPVKKSFYPGKHGA